MKKTIKISAKELLKKELGISKVEIESVGTELLRGEDGVDFQLIIDYDSNKEKVEDFNLKKEYKKLERIYTEVNNDIAQIAIDRDGDWSWVINRHSFTFGAPQFIINEDFENFIDDLHINDVTYEELEQVMEEVENENEIV